MLFGVVSSVSQPYNGSMKNIIAILLSVSVLLPAYSGAAAETDRYREVANRIVQLINTGNYSGIESLFNETMAKAVPLDKATDTFKELTGQFGKIQKLGEPHRSGEWVVFPAHCERGELEMSVALDDRNKVAGLLFKPSSATSEAAPGKQKTESWLPFKGRWLVGRGRDTKEFNHHDDVLA